MNVIKYKTALYELEITLDTDGVKEIRKDGKCVETIPTDMETVAAVVALALNDYGADGAVHDEESNVITLNAHATDWNGKTRMMCRMPRMK